MKTNVTITKGRYEAPVCDSAVYLQDCICAESVGGKTDDYEDGGNFEW